VKLTAREEKKILFESEVLREMRFEVLTAARMKMTVFWDVAPCSLIEVYRRFRGACCLHHQVDESSP
jgi:hypothetical protein